ncbi:hypothetical protein DNU06_10810 [Putridiphycobacter roseus]|uniref:Secretion system C-terminal sorting domain-containing protein n=1 Tax=Putridiphycobacter roseus TaxID=2219161 RepID=A0A2W1NM72_9FLAO|nr:T9SS type A sorting domain-containing protein [Putridiphycobacter roseus]PZE16742.1 hypothetical protein DNU06_10810 [Putridiphycobacter roseus]
MFRSIIFLFFLLCTTLSYGQIISQFDWDTNPVTSATVGPNAISVSGSAVSDVGGVAGTNGLNASLSGTAKADINLVIAGSTLFNVDGIDFSIDYHREESVANFFNRGSSLIIGAGNQFKVTYKVDDGTGTGGSLTVSSGNVYPIPNDDTFRRYRFYYLPATGEGFLTVDGTVVWTHDGPDNRNMVWNTSDNIIIGSAMDGSGSNDTFLDNMVIGSITNSALPVSLTKFQAALVLDEVVLNWETKSEINNERFEIERSQNGIDWDVIGQVKGSGNSSETINYAFTDYNPIPGQSYYRLIQFDFDGASKIYDPKSILKTAVNDQLLVYPNPANQAIRISGVGAEKQAYQIYTIQGKKMFEGMVSDSNPIDVSPLKNGLYILLINTTQSKFMVAH